MKYVIFNVSFRIYHTWQVNVLRVIIYSSGKMEEKGTFFFVSNNFCPGQPTLQIQNSTIAKTINGSVISSAVRVCFLTRISITIISYIL